MIPSGGAMLNGIAGIPLEILAPSALAGLAVLLILTGRLVPRRTYDDKAHEANEWRAESRIKDQQIAEQGEQIREKDKQLDYLAEVGRNVLAIMQAIQIGGRSADSREDGTK